MDEPRARGSAAHAEAESVAVLPGSSLEYPRTMTRDQIR